jgi:hypothetical protein
MEKIIQFLSSLPSTSATQMRITDGLITNLWNTLLHPPLSHVGDRYQYRAADGSNNVPPPNWSLTLEHHVSLSWEVGN